MIVLCYFIEYQRWDGHGSLISAPKGSSFSFMSIRQLVFLSTGAERISPSPYEAENLGNSGQNELVDREHAFRARPRGKVTVLRFPQGCK